MRRKPIFRTRKVNSAMRYVNKSNTAKHEKKYFKYLRLFSCNFPYNEDKSLTHRGNCTKYKLCNDVEENPGPVMHHVNPSKTIVAPYSQGDVIVFGQNAGQQCVAMSLCALIYHNMKGISNPGHLKQIMHIGNQLYSSLSKLSKQSFSLLTELPTMLIVLQENYQLEYSASYTDNVHGETAIKGYQYCMGLKRAFESLISEQYRSLILTVGCIAVSIVYCADNRHFKVFDFHVRDIHGKSHPEGTCILLDTSFADNLVQYFQSL